MTLLRTLRRPRWAMPITISFTPSWTAALDDLLQRRNHGFAAIEAEALGARVLHVGELLEVLRLDQLVEDRALASR